MSKTTGYCVIYGIRLSDTWRKEWENKNGITFISAYNKYLKDDIFIDSEAINNSDYIRFNGRGVNYIILGRIIDLTKVGHNPIKISEILQFEIDYVKSLVKTHFDVTGEFNYFLVTVPQ